MNRSILNIIKLRRELILSFLLLGFVSIATQIILLREFLSLFYGNELIIGLILTNWMLLTGLGSYIGRYAEEIKNKIQWAILTLLILSLLPFVLVFLMYYLRDIVFLHGSMINIQEVFLSSFLILLPFCLISGFSFTLLCHLISETSGKNLISESYSWESLGSIVGGMLFNLILVWFLETFESLIFLIIFSLVALFIISYRMKSLFSQISILIILGAVIILSFNINLDQVSREMIYQDQQVEDYETTPYGNIVVTKTGGQLNFFENNVLLFSSDQPIINEETVHYPMLQHANPENVLLLSAGVPGIIREVLKYHVEQIDYVEINPWLIKTLTQYSDIYENEKVNVVNQDAREFVEKTHKKYDVVFVGVPEPNTIQLNRFYTKEFYSELKEILNSDGIISFSISGSSNYLSDEAVQLYSSLNNTLKSSYRNTIIIPGNKNYFIASDDTLTWEITPIIEKKSLQTDYVNQYYIQDDLVKMRGQTIMDQLNEEENLNTDFKPFTYSFKLRQWVSHFSFNFWIPMIIFILAGLVLLFYLHPVNRGMFTAGFAGASLELILLVSFQILFGDVFQMAGIIITIFMAGLAFGTYYRRLFVKNIEVSGFYRLQYVLAIYTLIIPFILLFFKEFQLPSIMVKIAYGVLMFIASALVGMIFSMVSRIRLRKVIDTVSEIYSADLLGAAIGSFLISVYLIPVMGLMNVCFLMGGIVFLQTLLSSYQFRVN